MKTRYNGIAIAMVCLIPLILFYQNCSGGFKVINGVQLGQDSSSSGTTPTATPAAPGSAKKVDMVLVWGSSDTVTMSCDGGESWTYHGFDPAHSNDGDGPYSATSIHYQDGLMYRSRGWGGAQPTIEKSVDGMKWEIVYQFPINYFLSGFAINGKDFVYADGDAFMHSADAGVNWSQVTVPDGTRHLRALSYDYAGKKRMLFYGEGNAIVMSPDNGLTWSRTYSQGQGESACAAVVISGGAEALIGIGHEGQVCRSTDGGVTWKYTAMIPGYYDSGKVIWTGKEYIAYPSNQDIIFRSRDGVTWTSQKGGFFALNQSQIFRNSNTGKYYAYAYANTFVQSADGITWTKIETSKQPPTTGGDEYLSNVAQGMMTINPGHPCYK